MFMSAVDCLSEGHVFPELAGARVLVSGIRADRGLDIAREFAGHKARMALVSAEQSPALAEMSVLVANNAAELHLYETDAGTADAVGPPVQQAAADMGGFDIVVNVAHIEEDDIAAVEAGADPESVIAESLEPLVQATRIAANRMSLTWSEGSILNVVSMSAPSTGRAGLVADVARAMLAQLTRGQAREWAGDCVRINAIAPQSSVSATLEGPSIASEADIAVMALGLASARGRGLSGHVVEAAGAAKRVC